MDTFSKNKTILFVLLITVIITISYWSAIRALLSCRMALVYHNPVAGHWPGTNRQSSHGGSVRLCSIYLTFFTGGYYRILNS